METIEEPTFHYITIATKPHFILDNIKKRISTQNETITVLGSQENRHIGWQSNGNFGIKLKEAHEFIIRPELNNNDIVLFTDAYDVIYCGSHKEIIKRFLQFDKPIVFGCEKYCNPDPKQEKNYKFKDTEFPFLNSGLYIGRVWALRECISKYKYNDKHDDQLYWTLQFFNRSDLICLDYHNSIFLNTVGVSLDDIQWNGIYAYYKNRNPLFVHINGPDKMDLRKFLQPNEKLLSSIWFSKDDVVNIIYDNRELITQEFMNFLQNSIDVTIDDEHRIGLESLRDSIQFVLQKL